MWAKTFHVSVSLSAVNEISSCRKVWWSSGQTSGEVPGPDGKPEGQESWLCLSTSFWSLPAKVTDLLQKLLTALVMLLFTLFSAFHHYDYQQIPLGISPCVLRRGLTGMGDLLMVCPHWSTTWATKQRNTNWAGNVLLTREDKMNTFHPWCHSKWIDYWLVHTKCVHTNILHTSAVSILCWLYL